jgi:hypothetical protein
MNYELLVLRRQTEDSRLTIHVPLISKSKQTIMLGS